MGPPWSTGAGFRSTSATMTITTRWPLSTTLLSGARTSSPTASSPTTTNGGNLSAGQASTAGGMAQVTEAVRQIRRDGGEHQVPGPTDIIYVTGSGGSFSQQSAMVLASDAAL